MPYLNKFLTMIGGCSLEFYLVHVTTMNLIYHIMIDELYVAPLITTLIIFCVVLGVSIIFHRILNRFFCLCRI